MIKFYLKIILIFNLIPLSCLAIPNLERSNYKEGGKRRLNKKFVMIMKLYFEILDIVIRYRQLMNQNNLRWFARTKRRITQAIYQY